MTTKRLLVVDDEADFGAYVKKVAEGLGYQVLVTTSGRAFMAAFEDFAPSHVMLDVVMPEMDGIELVQWLAKRCSRVKVVIVTGYNPKYAHTAGVLGGAKGLEVVGIYAKPLRLADLRAVLA
ncbi:MAG: response regulator [Kiloniellales bacterium]